MKRLPLLITSFMFVSGLLLGGFSPARDILYAVPGFQLTRLAENTGGKSRLRMVVNVPAYRLQLLDGDREIKRYRCRIGSLENKTRIGTGRVTQKFRPAIFRYSEGEKAGEIIEYSRIMDFRNGRVVKTIRIPYENVCGLEINVGGTVSGQIIHSTTNPETLEYPHSHGCVGMSMEDMLDLYKRVPRGTRIDIIYEPVEFRDGAFYFHPDVYSRGVNFASRVEAILKQLQIPIRAGLVQHIVERGTHFRRVTLREVLEVAGSCQQIESTERMRWL